MTIENRPRGDISLFAPTPEDQGALRNEENQRKFQEAQRITSVANMANKFGQQDVDKLVGTHACARVPRVSDD